MTTKTNNSMELNKYQELAMSTCMETSDNIAYMKDGLSEEVGEVCGKFSKGVRKGIVEWNKKGNITPLVGETEFTEWKEGVLKELGDVFWMLSGLSKELGYTLEEVAENNIAKLADRKKRNVIIGEGDNR